MRISTIKFLVIIIQFILLFIQFTTGVSWLCIPIVLLLVVNIALGMIE